MKNPAKLVGVVLGTLLVTAAPGFAQETGSAVKGSSVNLSDSAAQGKGSAGTRRFQPTHKRLQKEPQNLPVNRAGQPAQRMSLAAPQSIATVEPQTLPEPSPSPSLSFVALPDSGEVAPPDTFGAVGPTHLVVACASDLRISDRLGGAISTVSQEQFWSGVAANIFDTRVVYDPYGQRFIMTAAADPGGTNPRLCIAVSASSNPTGAWYRWSEDVDVTNPVYADSPTLGFNKTWIVVQANMYNKTTFEFFRSEVFAYNKANLYANGAGQRTKLAFPQSLGASQTPATMYDSTNAVVYFVENWNGYATNFDGTADGYLRLFSLSGGIGSERLNITNSFGEELFVKIGRTWAEGSSNDVDLLPQLGSTNKICAGDSRIQNVHFRDGLLYAAHTVFLPATNATRTAVQWWVITASRFVQNFGRVEDPTGTNMFAYPSIAANRYQDMLLGYSRFSSNEYPSAAYSFREITDPQDELRGEVLLKAGQAPYDEVNFERNPWGDWSATTVDPVNDVDLWTLQEYAAPLDGARSRWGTWWGRVSPPVDLGITMTDAPDPVPSGNQITYTLQITNKLDEILSGVRVQDNLPAGVSYVSATTTKGSCGHTNGVVSCFIGPLTEFERETIAITVNAGLPAFVTNTAIVYANGPDFDASDNTAVTVTEIINSADLQVQGADSPDPVHATNTLTYTLSISNRGPSAAGGVVMTSTLPASVTIGTVTASQGSWNINGSVVSFTLGPINNGATAQISISCTPNAGGLITNQVRVAANTFDTALANNTVNISTRVNARPVINPVGTQTINEDVATVIPVTISDAETAAASLQFTAVSSNQGLIPNGNIVPGGSGQNRSLTVTSALNQFGSNTTTITVTVTDADGASTTNVFAVNVAAVNDPPTIVNIPNPNAINEDTSTTIGFTVGDVDSPVVALTPSANSSNPTLIPIPNITFSGSGSSRFVTLAPATNRSGNATITITVSDGSLSTNDTFVLTVNPINDPPVISTIPNQTTSEDTATAAIPFTVSDPETLATNLTVTAGSSDQALVPNGNITLVNLGTNRTLQVTPAANQSGVVTVTVTVTDPSNFSQSTPFNLTITAVNDRPTLAQPANITTDEDAGMFTVNLTGIGSGAPNESQVLSVRASTSTPELVENLQVSYTSPDPSGTLTFNLVTNAAGTALIDLIVSDGEVADDVTRQFQVLINGINDPPTIDPIDPVFVLEDSGQSVITLTGITPGAANEASQSLTNTASSSAPWIVPAPQITYVQGASTATLRFTPAANASGTATITVTVDDGRPVNPTTTRTFQITVDAVNDVPTISAIADRRINEDTSTGAIAFNFRDVEPGALTVAGFSSNQGLVPDGNVVITPATGTNRNVAVTPLPNEFGSATITVRITDSEGGETNETFLLTVDPVNDPPTLATIPNPPVIDEDAPEQTVNLGGITPGPSNESTQAVTITATSSNPSIVPDPVVNYTFPNLTGALTYTPTANATGSVVITVRIDDHQGSNNLASRMFTVQINPVNDAPTITGDFEDKFTDEDIPTNVTFMIGDVETPAGSLTLAGSSSNPELVADTGITFSGAGATRTVTVRPLTNEFGSTFISITVTDGGGATAEVGFSLIVNEVDDPPLISTIPTQTISEDSATATLSFWINDVDTPLENLSVSARSSTQAIVPDGNINLGGSGTNRNVQVTPAPNANGSVTIFLTADDGNSNRTSQFTLNVNSINDPPVFDDIPTTNLMEDAGLQIVTLTGVGAGAPNETTDTLTVSAVSSLPALIPNPVGTNDNGVLRLRLTPVANASGTANITVTVNDGQAQNPATSKIFAVNVQAVNDPPTLNAITDRTVNEDAPIQSVALSGISAGGGESQTLTFTITSSNPSLVPHPTVLYTNTTGVLRFTVAPNSAGLATITVRLSDGVDEIVQTFTVTVNLVNEPPTITTINALTTAEDVPVSAAFTIGDEETYAARLTLSATSTNTTLVPNTNIVFHGSDSNRWVTITPATNLFGLTRITITASDGTNNTTSIFNVTVTSSNDPPTLNLLPNVARSDGNSFTVNLTGITAGGGESQPLAVRVASSNTSLVPTPSVSYISANSTGSISVNPANSGTGSSVITVTVWDNGSPGGQSNSFSRSFTVYVRTTANAPPSLSAISTQTTPEDTQITIPFTVGDAATPAASLTVGAFSSNPELVPTNSIGFSGADSNRFITITPLPNRFGTNTITVWVQDAQFGYRDTNFVLNVTSVNDRPVISTIPPQTIDRGTNMPPVPFSISDAETPAHNLTVAAVSSNQGLLPTANIILGGAGTNRSVMAYPVAGQTGSATITITVTDAGGLSTNTAFVLTVRVPQPPNLVIRRAGPNVELLWPSAAGTYTVQGRDQLNAGNWTDIIATPAVSGTNYVVPQLIGGPHKFFRLRN